MSESTANIICLERQYPATQFTLLGNTDVMAKIPAIKSPVIQVIRLDPTPGNGDVYLEKRTNLLAITKNGLKKLADGAGIKMISSEHVIPTTCQKCSAANAAAHTAPRCWECPNKDVAYRVMIAVPQLTGEIITVEDTHEIIIEDAVRGMTDNQKNEFMKHRAQICEAKALNGAIRTALHIKSGYTPQELQKPFVVAYLVPNLDQAEVKRAAIEAMFASSSNLFGVSPAVKAPAIEQIEAQVPEVAAIEASDGENYDQYVDGTYDEAPTPQLAQAAPLQPAYQQPPNAMPAQVHQAASQQYHSTQYSQAPVQHAPQPMQTRANDFQCSKCGAVINEKVWDYSTQHFGQPLCFNCQKQVRGNR